jgi:hypothetical protein
LASAAPSVLPATSAGAAVSHAVVKHGPGAPSASATAAKPDCEQPYVVDSAGHMHFRKECL